jgi:hypothetical protein
MKQLNIIIRTKSPQYTWQLVERDMVNKKNEAIIETSKKHFQNPADAITDFKNKHPEIGAKFKLVYRPEIKQSLVTLIKKEAEHIVSSIMVDNKTKKKTPKTKKETKTKKEKR